VAAACCSSKKPMWVGWVEDTDKSSSPASDSAAGCKGSNKTAWWIEPRVPRQLGRRQAPDAFPAAPKILVGAVHVHTNAGRRRPFRTAARGCMDGEPPSLSAEICSPGPGSLRICMHAMQNPTLARLHPAVRAAAHWREHPAAALRAWGHARLRCTYACMPLRHGGRRARRRADRRGACPAPPPHGRTAHQGPGLTPSRAATDTVPGARREALSSQRRPREGPGLSARGWPRRGKGVDPKLKNCARPAPSALER